MTRRRKIRNWPFVLVLLSGCSILRPGAVQTDTAERPGAAYLLGDDLTADLQRDVFTLASEEMRGREAGSAGEQRAADYIADELSAAGILPGGDGETDRSYFQSFRLSTVAFDTLHTRLSLNGSATPRLGADWIAFPDHAPFVMMDSVEVSFAGHGIAALEQGYDDYATLNVAGKVVVALAGSPEGLDSVQTYGGTFAPGDFLIKWISAVQRGAAALVVVGEEEALGLWDDYATLARGRSMSLDEEDAYIPVMPYVFVSRDYGPRLLDELDADSVEAVPFDTDRTMALHLIPKKGEATTRNVVGFLPGSTAPEAFVAYGAHYDHLGMDGDQVFNGADDNASGVAAVLAAARAHARDTANGRPTKRSQVFVFHAAEEKGLLGARYFTENPGASVIGTTDRVVAHLNLDMVGREHPDSLYAVGAYRMSTPLGTMVDSLNTELGAGRPLFAFDRSYDDPEDPEKIFERSDHYRYAVQGIPIVFFTDGMGANWRKDTSADDYHSVTDDPEKIDFSKLARVSRLVYEIGRHAAADRSFPIDGEIPIPTD